VAGTGLHARLPNQMYGRRDPAESYLPAGRRRVAWGSLGIAAANPAGDADLDPTPQFVRASVARVDLVAYGRRLPRRQRHETLADPAGPAARQPGHFQAHVLENLGRVGDPHVAGDRVPRAGGDRVEVQNVLLGVVVVGVQLAGLIVDDRLNAGVAVGLGCPQ